MTERPPSREAAPTVPMWMPTPEDMDIAEAIARRQWAAQNAPPRLTQRVQGAAPGRRPRWLGSRSSRALDVALLYCAVILLAASCAIAVATWAVALR